MASKIVWQFCKNEFLSCLKWIITTIISYQIVYNEIIVLLWISESLTWLFEKRIRIVFSFRINQFLDDYRTETDRIIIFMIFIEFMLH